MDGFIYQQVSPSDVSDLMNMSKDVYELHDDNTESLVDGIVNESSTYGIEVGFLDELWAKAVLIGVNNGLGLSANDNCDVEAYNENEMDGMVTAMYEAIDEFEGMYNHCAGEDKDHYETRIAQLNNVLNLLNSLK